jgi:hypothetical protein
MSSPEASNRDEESTQRRSVAVVVLGRDDETLQYARALVDELRRHLGRASIIEEPELATGATIFDPIEREMSYHDVLLLFVGPEWRPPADLSMRYVDRQFAIAERAAGQALREDKPIIPVLLDQGYVFNVAALPWPLSHLAFVAAGVVRRATLERDVRNLIRRTGGFKFQ